MRRVLSRAGGLTEIEAALSTNTQPRWLKVDEVAGLLRVSKMTVYRLIASGELRSARVGRSYRLNEDDVNSYLQRGGA